MRGRQYIAVAIEPTCRNARRGVRSVSASFSWALDSRDLRSSTGGADERGWGIGLIGLMSRMAWRAAAEASAVTTMSPMVL